MYYVHTIVGIIISGLRNMRYGELFLLESIAVIPEVIFRVHTTVVQFRIVATLDDLVP